MPSAAVAVDWKSGLGLGFEKMQKVWNGMSEAPRMTECRLASQILGNKQRVCVFVGANNTQYREYLPYDAGECPRQYQCPYRPNEKPFDIKAVIKNIKEQFTD